MPVAPDAEDVEIVRQIVGAVSLSEVQTRIEALSETTWGALQTDLSLWDEYRFDNESKFKAGSLEFQNDAAQTRIDYRNMYCSTLGYPLFNKDGSRGSLAACTGVARSGSVRNKRSF